MLLNKQAGWKQKSTEALFLSFWLPGSHQHSIATLYTKATPSHLLRRVMCSLQQEKGMSGIRFGESVDASLPHTSVLNQWPLVL